MKRRSPRVRSGMAAGLAQSHMADKLVRQEIEKRRQQEQANTEERQPHVRSPRD